MEAGIYIHIPFCVRKCLYCDFNSACGTKNDIALYQEALLREIRKTKINQKADTLFFGGGTPSVYPCSYIGELIESVIEKGILSENPEITLEANPGTVTAQKLSDYRKMGINRLSIGLQSAQEGELNLLGRIHDFPQFLQTYEMAREAGFANINVDLMSAIPSQTVSSWQDTLQKVLKLSPEHISAYSLIIEEGTPFERLYGEQGSMRHLLPTEEEEQRMDLLTRQVLTENGYERYEISNFAKPGFECRHNLKYWNRAPYYGFGVSAASLVGNLRYTNLSDRGQYCEKAGFSPDIRAVCQELSIEEEMAEFLFLGLRQTKGISLAEFEKQFQKKPEQLYEEVIGKGVRQGLLLYDAPERRLRLTERGLDVSNVVLAEFL